MRIERLLMGVLAVAGTGVALTPAIGAQHRPVFQGEVQVWLTGDKTCTLSVDQTRMAPGGVSFVVGNASHRGYGVVLARRAGLDAARELGPGTTVRPGMYVDGLPAALPSGATAAFTPTLQRGNYDLWCTDRGLVRSSLGHASFTVGAQPQPVT